MAKKRPGLTKAQQRKRIIDIKRLMGKGWTDEEVIDHLEIRPSNFVQYKKQIAETDRAIFTNMDSVGVFSDYCLKMRQLVKELDDVKMKFKSHHQYTALVAAIKQKKEIYDSVIKMGQDFGFIEKKAKELKLKGELSFVTMTEDEVKGEIQAEVKRMNNLLTGQIDMREELLDVTEAEVKKYIPATVAKVPEAHKRIVKTHTRLRLNIKKVY